MSGTPHHSQGSFGSQPDGWEEPGGIMDSIVGIIPRSAPPRATSFSGLLNVENNDIDYPSSGPPTPYDNQSPPDEVPTNSFISNLPTFSFLNINPEHQNRRNITLSKLWDMNPLVSLPPPSNPDVASSSSPPATTTTTTTTTSMMRQDSETASESESSVRREPTRTFVLTTTERIDDDSSASSPNSPPVAAAPITDSPSTPGTPGTSPGTRRYNTRGRPPKAKQNEVEGDAEVSGIQPRSKRKRGQAQDAGDPTPSDPDPVSTPPPPARRARGAASAATPGKRGRPPRSAGVTLAAVAAAAGSTPYAVASPPPSSSEPPTPLSHPISTPIIPTTPAFNQLIRPPSPPAPTIIASNIKNMESKYDSFEQQVDELREQQTKIILQVQRNAKDELMRSHDKINAGVKGGMEDANQLLHTVVLDPPDVARVRGVRENMAALLVRLRMMKLEVSAYFGSVNENTSFAALIIREQPPPKVIFKGKDMGKIIVELITPTKCEIMTAVGIQLFAKNTDDKKDVANLKLLQGQLVLGDKEEVDGNNMAIFDKMKLNSSTRMVCSILKFNVSTKTTLLNDKTKTQTIESEATYPFVGITNESQWPEAAGKLLAADAFENGKLETTWGYYANTLQLHFLTITSQSMETPTRKLYDWELQYIHSRFGYRPTLTKDTTDKFWNFFGPVMLNIHFKRKIYELFRDGLIYGFISKEQCTSILSKHNEGTCLIRFSESIPGAFAIAYVDNSESSEKVRHYLVEAKELGANKTLPDLLWDRPLFTHIIKVTPSTRALEVLPKEAALQEYCLNKLSKPPTATPGYMLLA